MQERYASIIIDISHEKLDRTFQYRIPEALIPDVSLGCIVEIPFGKGNRIRRGYVVDISAYTSYDKNKIKEIDRVVRKERTRTSEAIWMELAAWMKENYGSTMIQALKVVLPFHKNITKKHEKRIRLLLTKGEINERLAEFAAKKQRARERLCRLLIEEDGIACQDAIKNHKITAQTIQYFLQQGIIEIGEKQIYRNPPMEAEGAVKSFSLNARQKEAVQIITGNYNRNIQKVYLLHGVTGSGKTEVYLEVIAHVIKGGRQAIVLLPEIALTYQTVNRFYHRFGNRVSVVHSRMSQGEKYDQFERAKKGEIDIVIGPRSALFTPFPNIGIIIMDEEHEASFKSEQMPKYHARDVAIKLAELNNASVILGSATPSINSYYLAVNQEYQLLTLPNRAADNPLPHVTVVDMREELKKGNRSIFSDDLRTKIIDRLHKKEQIMLFLNRRGYAGFISCRSCGFVMKCPHCDVSLCIHNDGKLVCHYCGYETSTVTHCPSCHSKAISGFKAGTQQVEELMKKEFPEAGILRMDMDSTKGKHGYANILSSFSKGEADILIGTQMIVKGHDFPRVTLVGIIAADLSLYANDYRACERTFQLLTQAAGRAGRDKLPGEVIIQTYSPDNYSIQAAARQDYASFYEQEIKFRSVAGYPPVAHLLCILFTSKEEEKAAVKSLEFVNIIKSREIKNLYVIGPCDAYITKVKDVFRKVIYVKHTDNQRLVQIKDYLESYMDQASISQSVYIQFDFDPITMI